MDIAFADEKDSFIEIHLDDITVFSKTYEDHLFHLKIVFEKCRKFGISLNPKKCLFGLEEGKLLGHIISKEGIKIHPNIFEPTMNIDPHRNINEVQSFIGKINVLRRFIPNLAEILREIIKHVEKGH